VHNRNAANSRSEGVAVSQTRERVDLRAVALFDSENDLNVGGHNACDFTVIKFLPD
jgi:hypothetical protein